MRVEPELPRHPKFRRLKRIVGEMAMEHLIAIWGHCQTNQRGEFWPGADAGYLELICDWDGEPGVLFKALTECGSPCGFVVPETQGIRIHDWNEMNSQTVANWGRNANGRKGKNPAGTQREPMGSPPKKPPGPGGSKGGSQTESEGTQREPMGSPVVTPTESQGEPSALSIVPSLPHSGGAGAETLRWDLAQEVIAALNALTRAQFRGTHGELTAIAQCLARVGNDVAGVKRMLSRQVALWKADAKSAQWLNPRTLFDDQKFDSYFAQRELPVVIDKKNAPTKTRAELVEELAQARAAGNAAQITELERQLTSNV